MYHQPNIRKPRNRSTEKVNQQRSRPNLNHNNNSFINPNPSNPSHIQSQYTSNNAQKQQQSSKLVPNPLLLKHYYHERKCQTPSLGNYGIEGGIGYSNSNPKKKGKSRQKSTDRKKGNNNDSYRNNMGRNVGSVKNVSKLDDQQFGYYPHNPHNSISGTVNSNAVPDQTKKSSPFKHRNPKSKPKNGSSKNNPPFHQYQHPSQKDRPISNLTNARHAKQLQHQLSNLNDSMMRQEGSLLLNQSFKKVRYQLKNYNHDKNQRSRSRGDCQVSRSIEDGKRFMKAGAFQKAAKIFEDVLSTGERLPNSHQSHAFSASKFIASINLSEAGHLQALYLLSVCKFHSQLYQQSCQFFNLLLSKDDHYRKNAYLFLAISFKKLNAIQDALLTLSQVIELYPKYYDAYILRSKLLSKQKRFYDAISDLDRCIKMDGNDLQAYVSKGDCLRGIGEFQGALKIYGEVLSIKFDSEVLLKRAIVYIECNQIEKALADLDSIIGKEGKNSQAFLFKGQAYAKSRNYNDAILSYEQAIKFNTSKKATTKALYEISKLKIQMGDFYGAAYNLQRADSLEVDMKVLQKSKIFTEGCTFVMKKKYKKGIENMNILLKKQHLSQQIKPLIYSFRSYGYFCQYKHLNATNDLRTLLKNGYKLDSSSEYNYAILEGIIACQNNNYSEARVKFRAASALRCNFPDPYIYLCLTSVCQYNRSQSHQNPDTRKKGQLGYLLEEAVGFISQAIEKQENYNSYYLLACLQYTLSDKYRQRELAKGKQQQDFKKNKDNHDKRRLKQDKKSSYLSQALKNIQKAIETSDDHVLKHFYLRALIRSLQGRYKQTLNDFNNVISLTRDLKQKEKEPQDPDQPQREKQILEVYLNRAKCYLLFDEKKKAFQDLQTYISCKPLDSQIHTVAGKLLFSIGACEDAIKAYNYSPNIDKNCQTLLQRTKCYLILKQLNLCLRDMEKLIEMGNQPTQYDYICLFSLKQASKNGIQNYRQALARIDTIQQRSQIQGNLFGKGDMLFYKGVFSFMMKRYGQAVGCFQESRKVRVARRQLRWVRNQNDKEFKEEMLENEIYCGQEIDYNIGIAMLLSGDTQGARKLLNMYEGFSQIFQEIQNPSLPLSPQSKVSQEEQSCVDITPFPTSNRLCSIFPEIEYNLYYKFHLSFCLPSITPPEISFQVESRILQQLSMNSTEARPDAPWIKRNAFGVIFTDEVVGFDVDINTEKSVVGKGDAIKILEEGQVQYRQGREGDSNGEEEEDEEQHNGRSGAEYLYGRYQDNFDEMNITGHNRSPGKANIKQLLALDIDVQSKLAKLLKKKQQTKNT